MSAASELTPPVEPQQPADVALDDSALHPFRFGLKALMLLMAMCSVQFALMSYLGILAGLLVGLVFCFLVLAGLVVTAMISWRGAGSPMMHRLDQLAIRLVLAIVLLAIASFLAGGGVAIYQQVSAYRTATKIQAEIGISATEQMIVHNNQVRWGLVVSQVDQGKPFGDAGGYAGDVILCDNGILQFYEVIEDNRGKQVSIRVAAGADMQPVEKCDVRQLELTVPD